MPPKYIPVADRIAAKIRVDEKGCHIWTGSISKNTGYGGLSINNQRVTAHTAAWMLVHGEVPDGLELDHLCRNRACCNPAHLEAVTHRVNMLRGATFAAANLAKTHCPKGHPYAGSNLEQRGPRRVCGECRRRHWREYWHRKGKFTCSSGIRAHGARVLNGEGA